MTTPPKLSVVIPCFNRAGYLAECLASIDRAADDTWEIVVVDDGSSEDIRGVVAHFRRVRYLWQANQGTGAARNTAIQVARGEYLCFLDSDDLLLSPEGLRREIAILDAHPEVGLVYSQAVTIDQHGRAFGVQKPAFARKSYVRSGHAELVDLLLLGNYLPLSGTLVRRSVFDRAGPFRTDLSGPEDWDCWLRIARIASVAYLAEPVTAYRVHTDSVTGAWSRDLARFVRKHVDIVERLFEDDETAARYAGLRRKIDGRIFATAAEAAYGSEQMGLARRYTAQALACALPERQWALTRECAWLAGKSMVPPGIRRALRATRRWWRVSVVGRRAAQAAYL
jgi:glycosyltransferase involved in cell wall biosynthesis